LARRLGSLAMLAALCALLITCVFRQIASYRNYGDINLTVGVWSAAALDAEHGILYRPLISPAGYGGSRYAPIRTLLQAGLMKCAFPNPITSAIFISAFSTALLMAGCYALMRRLELPKPLAAMMTLLLFTGACVRFAIFGGLADPLVAALSIWGLVAVTHIDPSTNRLSKWILIAAFFFALAVATKITSFFGAAAAILWLISQKRFKPAAQLAAFFALWLLTLTLIFLWASQGRMLMVLTACATAGGGLSSLLQAPIIFAGELFRFDPGTGLCLILALVTLIVSRSLLSLPGLLLILTALGTLAIFGSPGTDINHFLELQTASVLCIALAIQRPTKGSLIVATVVAAIAIASIFFTTDEIAKINRQSRKLHLTATVALIQNHTDGPILCDDPAIPILCGQRPYLLDCFMFQALTSRDPEMGDQLWQAISNHQFSVIILSPSRGSAEFQSPGSFGYEVYPHVQSAYELAAHEGQYFIFFPRSAN
jgi:hypothetical protein